MWELIEGIHHPCDAFKDPLMFKPLAEKVPVCFLENKTQVAQNKQTKI